MYAIGQGLMDDVAVEDIKRFEHEMIEALRSQQSTALAAIKETGKLEDDTKATLTEQITAFKRDRWKPSEVVAS